MKHLLIILSLVTSSILNATESENDLKFDCTVKADPQSAYTKKTQYKFYKTSGGTYSMETTKWTQYDENSPLKRNDTHYSISYECKINYPTAYCTKPNTPSSKPLKIQYIITARTSKFGELEAKEELKINDLKPFSTEFCTFN